MKQEYPQQDGYPEVTGLPDSKQKKGKPIDPRTPLERELDSRTSEEEAAIEQRAELQEALESMRHKIDPDYKARSRAAYLGSMKIDKAYSPANRVNLEVPENSPWAYRFCHDKVRDRMGMEDWEPIKDMSEAQAVATSAYLRKEADGRIYAGDSYLCKKRKAEVEIRNGMIYQRSQAAAKAAKAGHVSAGHESFASMHERTASESDPIGIRYTGNETDDQP